jgi:GNAT superfamily N-acetyltransferase
MMVNPSDVKKIEQNFFAVSRYWGMLKLALLQMESLAAMSVGIDVADVNWAWNQKPLNKNSLPFIKQIKDFYQKFNVPFWWWVYPCGQSATTKHILLDAGFKEIQQMSCMAVTLTRTENIFSPSKNITITKVTTMRERLLWENTCFAGFEMPLKIKKQFHGFVTSFDLSKNSPQKIFLAYWNAIPVTTSLLFIHKNTAGIYYVSTIPQHRNKGCCLALIKETIQEAKTLGISNVILQATSEGIDVYKKAGFTELAKADIYSL